MPRQLRKAADYLSDLKTASLANDDARVRLLVLEAVPPEVAEHLVGTRLSNGQLTLFVPTPAWAGRLRYYLAVVQSRVTGAGFSCAAIAIRVLPQSSPVTAEPRRPVVISGRSAELLRQTASCIDDSELADALERLARHGGR